MFFSSSDSAILQPMKFMKMCMCKDTLSMDWFKGKSTGNQGFYHQI